MNPASNRYKSVDGPAGAYSPDYDLAGHLQGDANGTYAYSARGRLSSELRSGNTFNYLYNGLEQRVYKSGPGTLVNTTGMAYYAYDDFSHLLGEYDASGLAIYETVYFDDTPVAALTRAGEGQHAATLPRDLKLRKALAVLLRPARIDIDVAYSLEVPLQTMALCGIVSLTLPDTSSFCRRTIDSLGLALI